MPLALIIANQSFSAVAIPSPPPPLPTSRRFNLATPPLSFPPSISPYISHCRFIDNSPFYNQNNHHHHQLFYSTLQVCPFNAEDAATSRGLWRLKLWTRSARGTHGAFCGGGFGRKRGMKVDGEEEEVVEEGGWSCSGGFDGGGGGRGNRGGARGGRGSGSGGEAATVLERRGEGRCTEKKRKWWKRVVGVAMATLVEEGMERQQRWWKRWSW